MSNYNPMPVSRFGRKPKGYEQSWYRSIEPITLRHSYELNNDVQSEEISWSYPNYNIDLCAHMVSEDVGNWLVCNYNSFPLPPHEAFALYFGDNKVVILGKDSFDEMTSSQLTNFERVTQREYRPFDVLLQRLGNISTRSSMKSLQKRSTQEKSEDDCCTPDEIIRQLGSTTASHRAETESHHRE